MVKVNPLEDKDFESKAGNYFGVGVYEVQLVALKPVTPDSGAPYINVTVRGEEDQEADLRLYISDAAAPYTIANLGRIAVHNQEGETKKQAIRDSFKKIDDTDKLTEKFLSNMVNMQAWILGEEDVKGKQKPNGGYYIRYNLYSYEPTPKKQTAADLVSDFISDGAQPASTDDIPFGDS